MQIWSILHVLQMSPAIVKFEFLTHTAINAHSAIITSKMSFQRVIFDGYSHKHSRRADLGSGAQRCDAMDRRNDILVTDRELAFMTQFRELEAYQQEHATDYVRMMREATTLPAMLNDRTRREREENDNPWLAGAIHVANVHAQLAKHVLVQQLAKLPPVSSAMLPMPDILAEMEEEEIPRAQGVKANDINTMLGRKQAKTKARANKLGRKQAKINAPANAVSAVSAVSLNKMLVRTRKRQGVSDD
jgi:hypothetical protein